MDIALWSSKGQIVTITPKNLKTVGSDHIPVKFITKLNSNDIVHTISIRIKQYHKVDWAKVNLTLTETISLVVWIGVIV